MEFGRLEPHQITGIDFTLPQDSIITTAILTGSMPNSSFEVRVGSNVWGRKEWVGLIYPRTTKDANFLNVYANNFNSIELNSTFYNIYKPEFIAGWKEKTSDNPDFKFYPKFAQAISHIRRLKNAEEHTSNFYRGIAAFEEKLGPAFLQLSDNFTPKSFPELKKYLESLSDEFPVFVELRHKQWFEDQESNDRVFNLLIKENIGAVIVDAVGRRDCLHMNLTTPHLFVRFVGTSSDIDKYRLDQWVDRIEQWREIGLQSVAFFIHEHDNHKGPYTIDYLVSKINDRFDLKLPRPRFLKIN